MNLRKYGTAPYKVAVVHGGPGGAGSMKPVALELSKYFGVLEPLQTAMSVEGQITELMQVLEENCKEPITLIGHSWGAMLIYMFAAKHKHLVKKIIMVSSGAVEEKYYPDLCQNREDRLTEAEREELSCLKKKFSNPTSNKNMNEIFARFGKLMGKLDTYDSVETEKNTSMISYEIFNKVWPQAHAMRKSGEMAKMGKQINCPVIAIHGDYDSHPIEGIRDSLKNIVKDFTFYELKKCGHTPWVERWAKEQFYKIILSCIN
ncbi:alpha/beta hydrolase [Clostridium sp. 'deep sea']|uniref:alpha/beta fold hydrolase n=1 Tax=Clostridium sp. 'deep sea' TaxID=2779445 RepID=UPI0018966BCD|nr:alpha/beta hydrolase [Clostridium sp. 'deep sea']QOR36350.1 alpha/beta hydrolase [Clostridium sp. 'deep sea']